MKRLQNEVREIAGEKEQVTKDDLESMNYLKAMFKETLLLHPPTMLVPHESTQDLKMNGYDISARTLVFVNVWAIHRDPNIWVKPGMFYPERFMHSSIDFKGMDFELIPFGGGRRICAGLSFAMDNNQLVLPNLMHKFNWMLPEGFNSKKFGIDRVSGLEGRVEKIAKQFDGMVEGILQEHIDDSLDTQADCDKHGEGEKMKDFMDVLLEAQRENSQEFFIDSVSIKAIILDMFVAGTDTSNTGLEWATSELLRHPKVLKQLQEEVRRITQGRVRVIEDDLEQMKYLKLKAVIKETLRLHPPVRC
ncbi:Cytochrome P450 71B14 [Bienertia sinuspersici]